MSWRVDVVECDVKIQKKSIKKANIELLANDGNQYFFYEAIDDYGYLLLNEDAQEWIDVFQHDPDLLKIFLKFNPKGKLLFSSEEGDNKGDKWGYEFDGKGNVKFVSGKYVWEVTGGLSK